jgi:hypothetical protein
LRFLAFYCRLEQPQRGKIEVQEDPTRRNMSNDSEYKGNKHVPYTGEVNNEEEIVSASNEPIFVPETDEFKASKSK